MENTPLPVQIGEMQVLIEMMPVTSGGEEPTAGGAMGRVEDAFQRAKETIINLSSDVVQAMNTLDQALRPDEFTLDFGIKFQMDGNVVIAALSSEATLNVKLVYRNKPRP